MGRSKHSIFRHDINGLRAIAVIVVVLFHFGVPGFGAGYLGVDVFFVISGFLMTSILMRPLSSSPLSGGVSSVWAFYISRAGRIVPGLVVLVAVLLLFGWWVLGPADYRQLAVHAGFALAFFSNQRFWQEAGYFDVISHEKWLLHTWSLSVEWQFYLLLPLMLMIVWRVWPHRSGLIIAVGLACVISFGTAVVVTAQDPSAAFYLLPARAWEMLVGGGIYLISNQARWSLLSRRQLEWCGLGLIALALVLFDARTPWPGVTTLLPVAGTAMVLLAARKSPGWALPGVIQWLGKASYSLYLWHWPVFVGLVYLGWQDNRTAIVAGIGGALLLAALSYHGVEQPTRRWVARAGLLWGPVSLATAITAVGLVTLWVFSERGVTERLSAPVELIAAETNNTNPYRDTCHGQPGNEAFPWCHFGGKDIRVVLVGDSHASMLLTAVRAALSDLPDAGMIAASYTGCQTLFDVQNSNSRLRCAEFNRHLLERLAALPPDVPVLVSNRLSSALLGDHRPAEPLHGQPSIYYGGDGPVTHVSAKLLSRFRQSVIDSACRLAEQRPVYWLRPIPEMPVDVPRWMARQALLQGAVPQVGISRSAYKQRHKLANEALDAAARQCNVTLLDPAPYLCDEESCYGSRDDMPLYYDVHHLSERGNRILVPLFRAMYGLQQ